MERQNNIVDVGRSPKTEGRQSEANCIVLECGTDVDVYKYFKKKGNLCLLTLNPYKKSKRFQKLQKIGPVSDWLRRNSKAYFLTQETNGDGTFHYHAVCYCLSDKVFRHMNMDRKRVGGPKKEYMNYQEGMPIGPKSTKDKLMDRRQEIYDECKKQFMVSTIVLQFTDMLMLLEKKQRSALRRRKIEIKGGHLARVLNYILKETSMTQYKDCMWMLPAKCK